MNEVSRRRFTFAHCSLPSTDQGRHLLPPNFDSLLQQRIKRPPPPSVHDAAVESLLSTAPRRQGRPPRQTQAALTPSAPLSTQTQPPATQSTQTQPPSSQTAAKATFPSSQTAVKATDST